MLAQCSTRPWGLDDHKNGYIRYPVFLIVDRPIHQWIGLSTTPNGEAILVTSDVEVMREEQLVTLSYNWSRLEVTRWDRGNHGNTIAGAVRA